jgi:polysaccharide biosynthesis/export protein
MKKTQLYSFAFLSILCIALLLLGSCVTQKQVKYLQRVAKTDTVQSYRNHRTMDYKIQAHDNLYIHVYGLDEKSYLFFNKQSGINSYNSYANETEIGLYLESYIVSDSGSIDFPLVGKVFVKDLKIDQAQHLIQSLINEYLKNAIVTVKMANFNITVLGEVKMPGNHKFYQDKVSIFEAISMSGDLTEFANRQKVSLIRQTKEGSRVIYLNLNDISILHSDYYYLESNDILYFAPLSVKRWGTETFPWALVFSAISTAVLLISYIKLK